MCENTIEQYIKLCNHDFLDINNEFLVGIRK